MIAPVWIASPPEVHSALLSSGPGPGPLLSAAGVWSSLSAEYASVADELTALLGAVQAGAWQGLSVEQYLAAHVPYLAWLAQASVDSAGVAAQHEVASSAYAAAVAAMPTLAELTANHVTHGVLVGTNFFGINMIPIALNEADYVRMWVQAATAMTTYHAVAGASLASAPRTSVAPPVLKVDSVQPAAAAEPAGSDFFTTLFNQLGQLLANPAEVIRQIMSSPAAMVTWAPLLFFIAYEAFFIPFGTTFWSVMLGASIALPIAIGVGASYLAAQGEQGAPEVVPRPAESASSVERPTVAVTGFASGIATPGAPAVPVAAAPAVGVPAAATVPVTGFGYLVGGAYPGTSVGPTLTEGTKATAPAARVPAVAAAVRGTARDRSRVRRRRRAAMRDFGDEYMYADAADAGPATGPVHATAANSGRGTGGLGFTGTVGKRRVTEAVGLATLAGDGFGGGPSAPMLPDTWVDGATECRESGSESK
ncbi:MAG: PPE domain-containing protein [Mycobacterium sp.]